MEYRIKGLSEFNYSFRFNQKDVNAFAEASGDTNPIHLDEDYAKNTIFKRRIIHGFLGGSVFSKVFGTLFPGEGTIYLKQDLSFYRPMHTGENYNAVFKVKKVIPEKNRAIIETIIIDASKNVIISGEALIQHDTINNIE